MRIALAALLSLLLASSARAADDVDPGRAAELALDEAEAALRELRYEKAGILLERARRSGHNGPRALARLYRLQGRLAATLGDEPGAQAAFARWLALEPGAELAEGTSPKITGPFQAAAAELDGAALRVDFRVAGSTIELEVLADPLAMVGGLRASSRGRADDALADGGRSRVSVSLPARGRLQISVAALDAHGNRLVEHELSLEREVEAPAPVPSKRPVAKKPPPPPPRQVQPEPSDGPRFHQAWLWGGAAVALGVAGGYYAWQASESQAELDDLVANSDEHTYLEAEAAADRLRTDSLLAGSGLVLAGACALTAVLLWPDEEQPRRRVSWQVGREQARVAVEWSW